MIAHPRKKRGFLFIGQKRSIYMLYLSLIPEARVHHVVVNGAEGIGYSYVAPVAEIGGEHLLP